MLSQQVQQSSKLINFIKWRYGQVHAARSRLMQATCLSTLVLLTVSCNSNTPQTSETTADTLELAVVNDFATQVIIPTYEQLVVEAETLESRVNTFVETPTAETLTAAQEAWIAARNPWEQSEAFAFGPASSLGYDGDLDDWPVNETDVNAILNSNDELNLEYIEQLQTTQKGFHTIELLLFGLENNKTVDDFDERELTLLNLLTVAFNQTAKDLVQSWVAGVEGNPAYQEVLATAGNPDNPAYPTVDAAVAEIVQGMIGCLDEVANEKIGVPLQDQTTDDLESRFSQTSLNDFKNNLLSVRNAYLGEVPEAGTQGSSLSDIVAAQQPDLDQKVKQQLEAAINAVSAIPAPIEQNITNEAAISQMEAAQTEILTLFTTIEEEVLPLVQS
ncbi:MAG: imelysin family protein [Microcoleaceae cyanobacterium]